MTPSEVTDNSEHGWLHPFVKILSDMKPNGTTLAERCQLFQEFVDTLAKQGVWARKFEAEIMAEALNLKLLARTSWDEILEINPEGKTSVWTTKPATGNLCKENDLCIPPRKKSIPDNIIRSASVVECLTRVFLILTRRSVLLMRSMSAKEVGPVAHTYPPSNPESALVPMHPSNWMVTNLHNLLLPLLLQSRMVWEGLFSGAMLVFERVMSFVSSERMRTEVPSTSDHLMVSIRSQERWKALAVGPSATRQLRRIVWDSP